MWGAREHPPARVVWARRQKEGSGPNSPEKDDGKLICHSRRLYCPCSHLLPSPQLLLSWKTKKTQHSVHSVLLPFYPVTAVHIYEDAGTHNMPCWDVPVAFQPGEAPLMQGPGGRSAEDVGRTLDLSQGLSLRLALPLHGPDPGQHPGT